MITILKASAGSGKTYHLTRTYIRLLLCNPSDTAYRHILAVTFTNKATDEMKNRILEELHQLASDPAGSHYLKDFVPSDFPSAEALQQKAARVLSNLLHDYGAFSVSTIQRWVRANLPRGAANPRLRDRRAFEEEWANGMWQADTMYGPHVTMPDGTVGRAYLQMAIDDKSRMVVAARFVRSDSGANFLVLLKGAVATYGVPRKLYVDNGAAYSNAQLTGACGRIGCVLVHTRVRDGASKGKIERANRALRNELLNNLDPSVRLTLQELNDLLAEWVLSHNSRPHSAHGRAPAAVWAADAAEVPPRMPESEAWLDEAFTCREERRVHKDASVFVRRVRFEAPAQLIGTKAEVRWVPGDLTRAWCVLPDGTLCEMRPTDRAANSRARRDNAYTIDWSEEA